MKKILAALFFLSAVCLLFTACGNKDVTGKEKTIQNIIITPYQVAVVDEALPLNTVGINGDNTTIGLTREDLIITAAPGDEGKIKFLDNGDISFTEAKEYHLTVSYKNNPDIKSVKTVQVYNEKDKLNIRESRIQDVAGISVDNKNRILTDGNESRIDHGYIDDTYEYLKNNGGAEYTVDFKIDFKEQINIEEEIAVLKFKYHTVFKLLDNGVTVGESPDFAFIGRDYAGGSCVEIAGNTLSDSVLNEKGYFARWGISAGTQVDYMLTMPQYEYLLENNPEMFIHDEKISFLIFGKAGKYELVCQVIDADNPEKIYFTQKNLLEIAGAEA